MKLIYLDSAATTQLDPRVRQAMLPFLGDLYANPSSIHSPGQEVRQAVEEARANVAALVGARADEIIFTSGGTEADNLAIKGTAWSSETKGNHIITSAIEHHAVLESCHFLAKHGFELSVVPVDHFGTVDPESVRRAITDKTILISIMHANNEIGTIQPVAEIGAIAQERGIPFHVDAVQTAGHLPIDVSAMNIDLLSISVHKLYGPKGSGALFARKGLRLTPLLHGGAQERNRRPGTENVPGIIGFGAAVELARVEMAEEASRVTALRDRLIAGVVASIPDAKLNGHQASRLPNNANFAFKYIEGESLVLNLDFEGISASTGSACSSSSLEPSHVLLACGLPAEAAHGSLRLSLGKYNTEEEIDRVIEVLPGIVKKLRAMSPLAPSTAK